MKTLNGCILYLEWLIKESVVNNEKIVGLIDEMGAIEVFQMRQRSTIQIMINLLKPDSGVIRIWLL